MYGCETWYFAKVFLLFCFTVRHNQRKILFWKKALDSHNTVVLMLAVINICNIGLIMSQYRIHSINIGLNVIKQGTWKYFIDGTVAHGKLYSASFIPFRL